MKKRLSFLKAGYSNFTLRRALRTACVVFLAMVLSYYYARTPTFWLTAIALILAQTELGFPLHQGLQRFFWVIILLFVGGQTGILLPSPWGLALIVVAITTLTAYSYAYHSRRYLGLHFSLVVLIILLLTLLMPASFLNTAYLFDILLGAALGLVSTGLIFPDKPAQEFPKRVRPLLKDLSGYLDALVDLMLQEPGSASQASHKRNAVEKRWAAKDESFPVWVFEAGFNPALKPGQYYFVVHLGQITEILFAMHHLARYEFPADLLTDFAQPIRTCAERTVKLLENISVLLEGKKLTISETDFIDDLPALEESFQSKIKLTLELLDISRNYVYLAAFIRYLKDLRLQLLQLASTLSE